MFTKLLTKITIKIKLLYYIYILQLKYYLYELKNIINIEFLSVKIRK